MKIGVLGCGFVGKATKLLKCDAIQIVSYDINPELCEPIGTTLQDLKDCEIIFISVPTPMNKDGSCYLNIVKSAINDLHNIEYPNYIILRSTVPVGTSDDLNVYFMPEFLTEKNFEEDFINNKDWIFGLKNKETDHQYIKTVTNLFNIAHNYGKIKNNSVSFVLNKEAELIKMFRNCFLATKVSFCNEIYHYCDKQNINYENVRNLACNDNRILHSHSFVPGHDGKLGFGGTCFPKDINSLRHQIKKTGVITPLLDAVIHRNENIDRPEKDWNQNTGRAVI